MTLRRRRRAPAGFGEQLLELSQKSSSGWPSWQFIADSLAGLASRVCADAARGLPSGLLLRLVDRLGHLAQPDRPAA